MSEVLKLKEINRRIFLKGLTASAACACMPFTAQAQENKENKRRERSHYKECSEMSKIFHKTLMESLMFMYHLHKDKYIEYRLADQYMQYVNEFLEFYRISTPGRYVGDGAHLLNRLIETLKSARHQMLGYDKRLEINGAKASYWFDIFIKEFEWAKNIFKRC